MAASLVACSNSGGPPSTGAFDPPAGGIKVHDPNVHVGETRWLALPPLKVRRDVRSVTITGLRLAAHYRGVVLLRTARFSLAQTQNRLVVVISPDELKEYSIKEAGPFIGTVEWPGDPVDYGAVLARFDRPGVVEIIDMVLSYRTPDGTGEQIIPCDDELTVSP